MIHIDRDPETTRESWDAFLDAHSFGEFQQTSMWARVKAGEGWAAERVVLRSDGRILGGFQILWKTTRLGRVGYASRGPVLAGSDPDHGSLLVTALKDAARRLCLAALIVQCPDENPALERALAAEGFLPNRVQRIVTATWVVPVSDGISAVEARMRRSTRRTWRQAMKRGVTVREGGEADLETFFQLMMESCRRQKSTPNPSSVDRLQSVWEAFVSARPCRLTLGIHDGQPVAGLFCLCFGKRVHVWKKGTLAEALPYHPMEPLYHDALEWAGRQGYEVCDFEAASRGTAEALLAGQSLTPEMMKSRDFYNMGFGGQPELLPEARIWFRNPVVRFLYRWTACSALGSRMMRRFYVC